LACLGTCGVWLIPESPKWFYEKKRYDEARKTYQFVAKLNRVK